MDEDNGPVETSIHRAGNKKGPKSILKWFLVKNTVGIIIILLIVAAGIWWGVAGRSGSSMSQVNSKEYQAVFLTNGQVYFGKLVAYNHSYLKLTDIYYLQVQQNVQPTGNSTNSSSSSSSSSNGNAQLVKLGNELHGPEDQMFIPPDQVLFWENLKSSGKVAQAITQYQNQNK